MRGLRGERLRWLLPVGGIELAQIARDALLELCPAPLHLRAREVLVPVVHRLELAAVDGNARFRKQTHLAAELDEARAHLADGRAIVLPEIGDRLVVGDKAAKQPHHLEVTAGLALKPPARLHPIEVAVDVKLQENRGMIGRPPGRLRLHPCEPEFGKIERIDERIDHTNRIILVDPVIEAFGQQRRLPAIRSLDKALHPIPANHLCGINRITAGRSAEAPRFHTARVISGQSRRRSGMSCVDGSRIARVDLMVWRCGRVQSCVRPVAAVHMTAGPDGMHG